ncbi:hypothetical protein F8M41_014439 [Gigaspora margarita]|uniref:Uncharacterized protein n=1 Tax=Gigaspora margarita TaxID=4874 RepID=A0A8H3WVB7_GIGMA|nr:hypothetical protein F8M41_014439 [Gigaspora margarita]
MENVFNETTRTLFDIVQMPVNSLVQNCTKSDLHLNAFIEVNGDYLAIDLEIYQIEQVKYQISVTIITESYWKLFEISLDGDRTLDLAYPTYSIIDILSELPDYGTILTDTTFKENLLFLI